jgi:hypothetical protein
MRRQTALIFANTQLIILLQDIKFTRSRTFKCYCLHCQYTFDRYFLVDIPLPVKTVEIPPSDIEKILVEAGPFSL